MPKKISQRVFDLHFPVGGLDSSMPLSQQPPYTTPDCQNVRALDSLEKRFRGGARPGLVKAYSPVFGPAGGGGGWDGGGGGASSNGSAIQAITSVQYVATDGFTKWTDTFDDPELGDLWSAASWATSAPGILNGGFEDVQYLEDVGAVRSLLTPFSTSSAYSVQIYILPYQNAFHGSYKLYARLDDTTPDLTADGVMATLTMTGSSGAYSGTLKVYVSGVETSYDFTTGTMNTASGGWFTMLITGDNVKCYWQGEALIDQTISSQSGTRFGFGAECTVAGGICLVDTFRIQYYTGDTSPEGVQERAVVVAGGKLYYETFEGIFTQLGGNVDLRSSGFVQTAQRGQKLYLADWDEPRIIGSGGSLDATGLELTATGITDWTSYGIDVDNDVVVISNGQGSVTDGTYKIASVVTAKVTLASAAGGSGACSYRIQRAPKVYDPSAGTLSIWSADSGKGQVPTGCKLICRYRDRLVISGADHAPHAWFMCRQGDPLDWDYSADADDAGRPVAGSSNAAGLIGDPVTCLAPHMDDYLVFSCRDSMWVLRGDPAYGGLIDQLSPCVGIIGPQAWCSTPDNEMVFLSRDGIYAIPPNVGGVPVNISKNKLPQAMMKVDVDAYTALLAYDVYDKGIHIYITENVEQSHQHYWLDWTARSFWPVLLQTSHEPTALSMGRSKDNRVLLGCRDGYVRAFDAHAEQDDGYEIESYIMYGPMRLGDTTENDGFLQSIEGVIGTNGGDVDYDLLLDETHQATVYTSSVQSGTWESGLSSRVRCRRRGPSFILKLSNGDTDRMWTVERITCVTRAIGRFRK